MEFPFRIRAALLVALRGGPASGLDIVARLERATFGAAAPSQGALYPALHRLEKGGLVRRLPPRQGRRRGRSHIDYELTLSGMRASDAVQAALESLVIASPPRSDALDERMRDRIAESAELSQFAAGLRATFLGARGR